MYFVQLCFATDQAFLCNHKLSKDRFPVSLESKWVGETDKLSSARTKMFAVQVRQLLRSVCKSDILCWLCFQLIMCLHVYLHSKRALSTSDISDRKPKILWSSMYKPQHVISHIIIQTFVYKMFTPSLAWTLQIKKLYDLTHWFPCASPVTVTGAKPMKSASSCGESSFLSMTCPDLNQVWNSAILDLFLQNSCWDRLHFQCG